MMDTWLTYNYDGQPFEEVIERIEKQGHIRDVTYTNMDGTQSTIRQPSKGWCVALCNSHATTHTPVIFTIIRHDGEGAMLVEVRPITQE